jgi:hypothetical protein
MTPPSSPRVARTFEVVERVRIVLAQHGVDSAVIGAIALAIHGYPRATEDVDLATCENPFGALRDAARALRDQGFAVTVADPDEHDPLGAVITVSGDEFDSVQVVNFHNPFSGAGIRLGQEALREACPASFPGAELKVVGIAHLVALKLYAGGARNRTDVMELLERNRPIDVIGLREVCGRFGLGLELDAVLRAIGQSDAV